MPPTENTPVLEINNVNLSLGEGAGRVDILKNVSLKAHPGETIGIVGPSGSGKTSLLMVTGGLETIQSGEIRINGQPAQDYTEDQFAALRGRMIGMVYQSFHLIPTMRALENVAIPLELQGKSGAFALATSALRDVGLGERLNHFPAQLSGGEQQRVAIARALVTNPAILLADEPTGNLDKETGEQITSLLFNAVKQNNTAFIMVTHDRTLAAKCDSLVHMNSGILSPASLEDLK